MGVRFGGKGEYIRVEDREEHNLLVCKGKAVSIRQRGNQLCYKITCASSFSCGKEKVINAVVPMNTVSPTKPHIIISFPQRIRHFY